jgi:hypothetical protein
MRRTLVLLALLSLPLAAMADDCRYSAPRNLSDDLSGIRGVQIEVHSHDLHLAGTGNATGLTASGRACSSSQSALDNLQITKHREGDQLIIDVGSSHAINVQIFGFGESYEYVELQMQLPSNMPVTLTAGSGDAYVGGFNQLDAETSSGDLHIRNIAGTVNVTNGSGDVEISDVGTLHAGSIGSGDLRARNVRADVRIGSVGSGDVELNQVGGSVTVGTLGSGDLKAIDVHGDLTVGAKGSGDITHENIGGKVSVPHDDDD